MALAFQRKLKQALFEELQNILSADKDIRTSAEAKIKQLEFTEGIYFHMIIFFGKLRTMLSIHHGGIYHLKKLFHDDYRLWRVSC